MDNRAVFDTYLKLLRQVVAVRGGDPDAAVAEFVWPEVSGAADLPNAAVSLSPLLTGSPDGMAPTPGIATVPPGLTPPKA